MQKKKPQFSSPLRIWPLVAVFPLAPVRLESSWFGSHQDGVTMGKDGTTFNNNICIYKYTYSNIDTNKLISYYKCPSLRNFRLSFHFLSFQMFLLAKKKANLVPPQDTRHVRFVEFIRFRLKVSALKRVTFTKSSIRRHHFWVPNLRILGCNKHSSPGMLVASPACLPESSLPVTARSLTQKRNRQRKNRKPCKMKIQNDKWHKWPWRKHFRYLTIPPTFIIFRAQLRFSSGLVDRHSVFGIPHLHQFLSPIFLLLLFSPKILAGGVPTKFGIWQKVREMDGTRKSSNKKRNILWFSLYIFLVSFLFVLESFPSNAYVIHHLFDTIYHLQVCTIQQEDDRTHTIGTSRRRSTCWASRFLWFCSRNISCVEHPWDGKGWMGWWHTNAQKPLL